MTSLKSISDYNIPTVGIDLRLQKNLKTKKSNILFLLDGKDV